MLNFIFRLCITAIVSIFLEYVLEGVHFSSWRSALVFALLLAILNISVKPLLKIIGLPLNMVTLGGFSLIINTIVILIADYLHKDMHIDGFGWAFIFGICLSTLSWIVQKLTDID